MTASHALRLADAAKADWSAVAAQALSPLIAGVTIGTFALVLFDGLFAKAEKLAGSLEKLAAETVDVIAMTAPAHTADSHHHGSAGAGGNAPTGLSTPCSNAVPRANQPDRLSGRRMIHTNIFKNWCIVDSRSDPSIGVEGSCENRSNETATFVD